MIRGHLIEHVANPNTRERRPLEPDLRLDKALTVVTQVESAVQQVKAFAANDSVAVQVIWSFLFGFR